MEALRGLAILLALMYGCGYLVGYCVTAPAPPVTDPLVLPRGPRPAPPPALVFTAGDLRAMRAPEERLGTVLFSNYWLGVFDAAEMFAAMERVGGPAGRCCGRAGPLAFVGMRAFAAGGFTPAVEQMADLVTSVARGRTASIAHLAVYQGLAGVGDAAGSIAVLAAEVARGGPPQRIPLGEALPARRAPAPVTGCGAR